MQTLKQNRLAGETSPYLLQHAHNPVNWYPWGEEAFAAALGQDKPIFLSVGYSTCYWCHVMERECFESEAIAADMNRDFICIKVDREERPDVDQLYMTAVQLLTHSGGWPMSVFLTPDLKPFYGGTYFPPTDVAGRPGFPTLLRAMADAWSERRDEVYRAGESMVAALQRYSLPQQPEVSLTIDAAFIDNQIGRAISDYDREHGGFGGAPKFPRETLLQLLLAYCEQAPSDTAGKDGIRKMLAHTLEMMARGGIRDQLGGGFHRYATDAKWLIPHFEIMLYDNAMLLDVYARAAVALRRDDFAQVARGIADFVLREMTGPRGEFYTAFDAEVDGREGASYLWTREQIAQVLSEDEAAVFNRAYGLDKGPNFADPHHGSGEPEANVLFVPKPWHELAKTLGVLPEDVEKDLAPTRAKLLAARRKRKQPLLDTKVLTAWNAMMARGLVIAGRSLNEPRYLAAAQRNIEFLMSAHRTADHGLWHSSRDGACRIAGFLDDYACVLQALVELHAATQESRWLETANDIRGHILRRFASPSGAFYFTDAGSGEQLVRQVVATDSPLPSGNAVAALTLLAMGEKELPLRIISTFADSLDTHGEAFSALVEAATQYVHRYGPIQISPSTANDLATIQSQVARAVKVSARLVDAQHAEVTIRIAPGFHINSSDPPPGLWATRVSVEGIDAAIDYPPVTKSLSLLDGPVVSVYQGEITVRISAEEPLTGRRIIADFQPCSPNACLERRRVVIPL